MSPRNDMMDADDGDMDHASPRTEHLEALRAVIQKLRQMAGKLSVPKTVKGEEKREESYYNLLLLLKMYHRSAQLIARQSRAKVATESDRLDEFNLVLQNILYEKTYLERQIEQCLSFPSVYQHLSLEWVEDLHVGGDEEVLAILKGGLDASEEIVGDDLNDDQVKGEEEHDEEHHLMLARLIWERNKRRDLQRKRKTLEGEKAKIIRANRDKKTELDLLDRRLDAFVLEAQKVRATFGAGEGNERPPTVTMTDDSTAAMQAE